MSGLLSKRQQARNEKYLQDLVQSVSGNNVCADCQARNPAWASWNLGIFLCMRCAAIHRKLGTHVSKVKSLSMDSWSNEQVDNMRKVGNAASNKVYNPIGRKPAVPIDADEADSAMERFIRQKYINSAFSKPTNAGRHRSTDSSGSDDIPPPLPPKTPGRLNSKRPGKPTSIVPQKAYADKAAHRIATQSNNGGQSTTASYAEAAAQCRAKVAHIVKECRRINQKYRDPHFDLELDIQLDRRDCLESLSNVCIINYGPPPSRSRGRRTPSVPLQPVYIAPNFNPQAVKRVPDIFDHPEFFIDGPTANDPGLIERVCVAHDATVGVYGFVFHRDGEWFSEIIDDKLYLTKPNYDESRSERNMLEDRVRVNSEEAYRKIYQSNSGALYFAQCENPNETWLPLLEKAYAKAHGDYASIEGGFTGEGIEDLTGGVTSELYTSDILDKEHFWNEELLKVNDTFLFSCSTGVWGKGRGDRGGIVEQHAYSVMRAIEMDGVRLVLLKNSWGRHEWRGAWSDGSKEWTADWIQKLKHRFGDDGSFWISYEDLLRKYQAFDRTRLFGDDWTTASIWTTMTVPWTLEYNDTKFSFALARPGPVVLVLSQLDERYFRGLEGQYLFSLSFRLHKVDNDNEAQTNEADDAFDYIVRSQPGYRMSRSVSVEVDLDAGRYVVLVKIDARRDDQILPAEDVIRDNVLLRREKLIRIGLAYDLAHSKGRIVETSSEKKARRAAAAKRKARQKERLMKDIMEERALDYLAAKIRLKKQRRGMAKAKAKRKDRDVKRRAHMKEEERSAEKLTRGESAGRETTRSDRHDAEVHRRYRQEQ
ncbi:hypothetical protein SPBR_00014 [Sporothrix brasiliensis 5110]|uniref:Calpain-like protein n=1 Tax=Sporothrix brasiliensis 5110 TaxID=1398154 RepID=A0A0C2IUI7_9PEZI|nr:uncharacterized protein SPBR_00014 [Sporothrix brasiliensis 5110]KIH90435.1 hypothetical protein SPBR_00014 [Sporothrix brasiliensis 5110]